MRRYVIVFEESAQADVRGSYDWGCRVWGKREAKRWVRQLRTAVFNQLSLLPKAFRLRRRTMSSQRKFARWLWVVIVSYSPLENTKFMCFTLEELMSKTIDDSARTIAQRFDSVNRPDGPCR